MRKPKLLRISDVEEREIKWLWYPYIPAGVPTLLFGPGGVGKSTIASDIAARISTGEPFPTHGERRKPGHVLIMSAEDDVGAVMRPRLRMAGADLERIFTPDDTFTLNPQGLGLLKEYIATTTATIAFIDPIVSWMGGSIDINKSNEVRALMGAFIKISKDTGTAIVVVAHAKKGGRDDDLMHAAERAMGSADFNNSVRSNLYAHLATSGETYLYHAKSNYGPLGDTIAYNTKEGHVVWGQTFDHYSGVPVAKGNKPRAVAVAFLQAILAHGPVPATEIEAHAADEGINKRTLARAKDGIVESFYKRLDGKGMWFWRLIDGAQS